MYLDESGDHSLDKIDPQFPVFALAGCVFDKEVHDGTVESLVRQYKLRLFGRHDIVLHTADIARNQRGFEMMKDRGFRQRFYDETNAMVANLDFTVLACVILKQRLFDQYGKFAFDPYVLSMECLIERFVYYLQENDGRGQIIAESRNPQFDRQLDLAFQLFLTKGTRYVRPARLAERLTGLTFRHKRENIAGLQIADLVATPIARAAVGKPVKDDYRIVEAKFRRRAGDYRGAGLAVIPK
ncbi:MAG: DUF3800 domain-containing protein [Sphingomonadaceae bacterium]